MPDIAVLDPTLTTGLPGHITAATGIDAFTHCMEAYLVDSFHPMADAIALEGMKMIIENLPKVMDEPNDLDARGQMLLAATMGATAFQKGLGMIHSMAHPLSAIYNIHHGLANALMIKFCLEFSIEKAIKTGNKTLQKKATEAGFDVGTRTIVDVLDSTRNLFDARRNLAGARYDFIQSVVTLKQAAGTLTGEDVAMINRGLKPAETNTND